MTPAELKLDSKVKENTHITHTSALLTLVLHYMWTNNSGGRHSNIFKITGLKS